MDNLESIKRKTYPPSFKTLFASLLALFALSGIAWASVEFSSGTRSSSGDGGSAGPGSSYGGIHRVDESLTPSSYNPTPLRYSNPASTWGLPDGASRAAHPLQTYGWGTGDTVGGAHNQDSFLNGSGFTDPGTSGEGPYNRVSILSNNNRVTGATDSNFPLFNYDIGGGGGGGGGGSKNNAFNQQTTSSGTQPDSPVIGTNTLIPGTQTTMSPAPEPETYAMLVTGLTMLGLVSRFRKTHGFAAIK